MAKFAAIEHGAISNVVLADSLIDAELGTGLTCFEFEDTDGIVIGDLVDSKKMAQIKTAKAKQEADAKAAADKAEAARVKSLEVELERARQAEAKRIAVEEAAKPKPILGIFVKVEKN
jgi:uncharacterized protein YaiL (DUF2058 family)